MNAAEALKTIAAATAVAAAITLTACSSPGAAYTTRVIRWTATTPENLAVAVRVTNTSTTAGTPDCTVTARDPSGNNTGINEATLASSVSGGKSAAFVMQLTITNQGAATVTRVTANCT